MKKLIVATILILFSVFILKAQNEKKLNYRYSLDNVKEVVITTNGYTEIENSISNQVECELKLTKKGKVVGFSNKDELEEPEMVSVIKDSTLYISLKKRSGLYVIGVSSYSEELKYRFKIPVGITVEIKNSEKCYVNGRFRKLILNTDSESDLILKKDQIKYLNCISSDKTIKLNGVEKGTNYFFESKGTDKYIIKSKSIIIQLI